MRSTVRALCELWKMPGRLGDNAQGRNKETARGHKKYHPRAQLGLRQEERESLYKDGLSLPVLTLENSSIIVKNYI